MKFLKKFGKFTMDVIETPFAIAKDFIALAKPEQEEAKYTVKKIQDIRKDWTEMKTALDD